MPRCRSPSSATPGSPGYLDEFSFSYDPELSKQLLAKSGFGPDKPAKIRMASTNGQFPSDYDMARAIVQMWKKVGIEAELEVIEYAKYFELNRGDKLPEATLYTFDNATGDPEIYTGYLLNPKLPFSPWKDMTLGQKVIDQFNVADERAAHRRLARAEPGGGGNGRQHAAAAKRADAGAQEDPWPSPPTATAGSCPRP